MKFASRKASAAHRIMRRSSGQKVNSSQCLSIVCILPANARNADEFHELNYFTTVVASMN